MANSFLSMVGSLSILLMQLPRAGSEPFQKAMFKRFRQTGIHRQYPGVIGGKAPAFDRILRGHDQPLASAGTKVFRAEAVMIGKSRFGDLCSQVPQCVKETSRVAYSGNRTH